MQSGLFGNDARFNWFSIRGVRADAQGIFLNGLPLYQYGFGGFYIDSYMLERIEVIKGPSGALYGGAAIGGIVNQVTKRPTGERLREVEAGVNSWGNGYFAFDIGDVASANNAISYRVTGKTSGGGWETDDAKDWRGFIAPSVTWSPDADTNVTLLTSFTKLSANHTGGFWPYVGTAVDAPAFGKIPKDLFYGDKDLDDVTAEQAMLGYELDHKFDNGITFRQNLRFNHLSSTERGPYPYGYASDTELFRIGFGVDSNVNLFTVDNQLEGQFDTGGAEHTLLGGVDYKRYHIDHEQWTYSASPLDVTNPNHTGGRLGPNNVYLNEDLSMSQVGVYLQDQIKFGNGFIATLNGRYDRVSTDVWSGPTAYSTTSSSQDKEYGRFSGRAGLAYEFSNGMTPYVSYTSSFDPSIGTDGITGALFKPVTGEQFEVGVKYAPEFFDGLITASYFDMTRQNVPVALVSNPFLKQQLGEVGYKGFELEAQADLTQGLKLTGALTLMDVEITEDDNAALIGNVPTLTPERTASLWLDYSFQNETLAGWSLGAGVRHTGSSWADAANSLKVPSVTLFDAAVRYDAETWGASLNVSNIFDKTYVSGCSEAFTCGYGEGRTFTLKVNAKF